jgi:membrane peptidoglycan carboxypeptidase
VLGGKKTLTDPASGQTAAAIGIGQYEMQPIDQAIGFATFASGGVYRGAHFVAKVTDVSGAVLLNNTGVAGKQVIPRDVAHDVTYALTGVAAWSRDSLDGNRPVACKTGTQNLNNYDDTDAWMVGYTPSISTAVWMGSDGHDAIRNASNRPIYGAGLPGHIWKAFMNAVLDGTPTEQLPTSPIINGDTFTNPVNAVAPTTSAAPTTVAAPTSAAPTTAARTTTAAPTGSKTATKSATATATTSATATATAGGSSGGGIGGGGISGGGPGTGAGGG